MLYVVNPDTHAIDTYTGTAVMLRPCTTCLAPCCDVACEVCSTEQQCPHTEHSLEVKFCVNALNEETAEYVDTPAGRELVNGEYTCLGTYTQSASFTACICPTEEVCTHDDERAQLRVLSNALTPGREWGLLKQRRFAQARARVDNTGG